MPKLDLLSRLHPTPTKLAAGSLVVLGYLLSDPLHISWWFIALTGLGTFGPGILRELGWLKDKDECQQSAARRAGYHAFLVTGLAAFLCIAFFRSGERNVQHLEELATFFLIILWFTWMFSSLVSYWGARKTVVRTLLAYGGCWFLFNILANLRHPIVLIMQCLITLPFFGGAYLSWRWPRTTGWLLLAASAFFFRFFHLHQFNPNGMVVNASTAVLFIGPLCASGLCLLFSKSLASEG